MNILFVQSGNNGEGINPIIVNQAESIIPLGVNIEYYSLIGKGFLGYLRNIRGLRTKVKSGKYNIVHAHYLFCGVICSFSGAKRIVVSLMGSDLYLSPLLKWVAKIFSSLFWDKVIVKSKEMSDYLKIKKSIVMPNGVDLKKFQWLSRHALQQKLLYKPDKSHILFVADPKRKEKNYKLALEAMSFLDPNQFELHVVFGIENCLIVEYINASNVLLLTSQWEGSPNIVKEAMACNCPIVATKVGDIPWLFEDVEGCFLAPFDPLIISNQIKEAILINQSNGRDKIIRLGLNSETVALKLIDVYKTLVN